LLDDLSDFTVDTKSCVALRKKVFQLGASLHPVVQTREGIFEHDVETARQQVAESVGKTWEEIQSQMFADVIELQPLRAIDPMTTATELLSSYNLAQTQAALYRATEVRVQSWSDLKTIVRHAKLARLMHRIDRLDFPEPGFQFDFDGPGSTIRETTRYGIGFAKLLGKLVTCQKWQMTARVLGPRNQPMRLVISPKDGLRSSLAMPDDFDSELEREVEKTWQNAPVTGWTLERETELLYIGQTVLTPDFVLRSDGGRMVLVEVVGFWTPEYLAEKTARLKRFAAANPESEWLLMFPKSQKTARDSMLNELNVPTVVLGRKITPADWIASLC
jgi:predicted nuclease of restriction endonuclease-like RecB superfamily